MSEIDLSISIVNYNTREYLRRCLNSIFENVKGISFEIIVVDNASTDGSVAMVSEEFPSIRLITNSENRYFTAAHNQALAIARGQYFLILNSDTLVPRDTLSKLLNFISSSERAGVVTCREVDGQGNPVITSTRFPSLLTGLVEWTFLRNWPLHSVLDRYLMSDWQRDTTRTIDVGTGCFLMARTSLLKQFGGFDEGIRLYYSEHDLCRQVARAGFEVHFRPEVHYVHFGQRSSSQESLAVIRKIHFEDMLYYFGKYHGKVRARIMMIAIRCCRFVESLLRRLSLRVVSARRQGAVT
ncbi:MAG: glycosyltransferase family 2 protein [Acidobacteriota bacterium]